MGAHAVEHCPAHIYTPGPNILCKLTPEIIFTAGMLCSLLILHMQQLSNKPRITTAVVKELQNVSKTCERLRQIPKKYIYEADVSPQVLEVLHESETELA